MSYDDERAFDPDKWGEMLPLFTDHDVYVVRACLECRAMVVSEGHEGFIAHENWHGREQRGFKQLVSAREIKESVSIHWIIKAEQKHKLIADLVSCPRCDAEVGVECSNLAERRHGREAPCKYPHRQRIESTPIEVQSKYYEE